MPPIVRMWNDIDLTRGRQELARIYLTEGGNSEMSAGGMLLPEQQGAVLQAMRAQSTLLSPFMPGIAGPNNGTSSVYPATANPNPMIPNQSSTWSGSPGMAPIASGGPGISYVVHGNGKMTGTIEGFLATGHVTRGATQATNDPRRAANVLKPFTREWRLRKNHVEQEWAKEQTFQTILEGQWETFLFNHLMPLCANDAETAALHGDEDIVGTDPRSELLKINDGWLKQMRAQSRSIDYRGSFVDEALFFEMLRGYPDLFQPRRKYWFCHPAITMDWMQVMRASGAGAVEASMALMGMMPPPLGTQFWTIPLLSVDEAITTVAAATPARAQGTTQDQFIFPTDAYRVNFNINGAGVVTVPFPHQLAAVKEDRSLSIYRVCKIINDALVAAHGVTYRFVARPGQFGRLELVTPNTGAARSIVIAAPSSSALGVLGLTAGTYSGQDADAGGGNTLSCGTSLFLSMPENLVYRVSTAPMGSGEGGFSQAMKYIQESDSHRYDAYYYSDHTLDVPEASVIAYGVRAARSGESPV